MRTRGHQDDELRHQLDLDYDHGESWWSKINDRHWNGCGTKRLLRTCKSYNAKASLESWGLLGWGRQPWFGDTTSHSTGRKVYRRKVPVGGRPVRQSRPVSRPVYWRPRGLVEQDKR